MTRPAASAQRGIELTDAVRAFIGTSSVREGSPACQIGLSRTPNRHPLATGLYLRHPHMQPKVPELMAVRADLFCSSFKAIVFLARARTR
jgi:hypothetical protein